MPQLQVGHSVYRIECQYLLESTFTRENGVLLSAVQLSAKMVRCGKSLSEVSRARIPIRRFSGFSESDGLVQSYLSSEAQV